MPRVRFRRTRILVLLAALVPSCTRNAQPVVGTLERDRLELVAEAFEPVRELLVHEGEDVAAGQVILVQDDAAAAAQRAQAEAVSTRAHARLAELERGPRTEQIREARARLAGADDTLVVRRRELDRARAMMHAGSAAPAERDLAQAAYDATLAERDRARAALDAMLTGTTAEELAQARAAVAEAEAAVAVASLHHERLTIRAPRDGRVDALPFKVGERPPIGAVVAVVLAAGAPYARVYVAAALRPRVHVGDVARVRLDGLPRAWVARLRTVSADAAFTPYFALTERDRGRLVYLAELDLTEPEANLLPTGVPVEAEFPDAH
ncbi:MAG: HlyD family efflux transporter periplasmic adaptor subunit [Candidatus Binatia bacterium]